MPGAPVVHGTWVVTDDGKLAINLAVVPRLQVNELNDGTAEVLAHFGGIEHRVGVAASTAQAVASLAATLDKVVTITKPAPA